MVSGSKTDAHLFCFKRKTTEVPIKITDQGVQDLAISLLDCQPGLGGKPDLKLSSTWELGTYILTTVVRYSPKTAPSVAKLLTKRIISARSNQMTVQYTGCLTNVVKRELGVFMEKPDVLMELLEQVKIVKNRVLAYTIQLCLNVSSIFPSDLRLVFAGCPSRDQCPDANRQGRPQSPRHPHPRLEEGALRTLYRG